jgi:hypothetical protein
VARLLKLFDAVGTSGKASGQRNDDDAAAATDEGGEGKDRPRPSSSAAPLDDSGSASGRSGDGLKVKPQGGRGGVFGSLQRRISVGTIAHEVTFTRTHQTNRARKPPKLTFFACVGACVQERRAHVAHVFNRVSQASSGGDVDDRHAEILRQVSLTSAPM